MALNNIKVSLTGTPVNSTFTDADTGEPIWCVESYELVYDDARLRYKLRLDIHPDCCAIEVNDPLLAVKHGYHGAITLQSPDTSPKPTDVTTAHDTLISQIADEVMKRIEQNIRLQGISPLLISGGAF